jgi:hypothetical protein
LRQDHFDDRSARDSQRHELLKSCAVRIRDLLWWNLRPSKVDGLASLDRPKWVLALSGLTGDRFAVEDSDAPERECIEQERSGGAHIALLQGDGGL